MRKNLIIILCMFLFTLFFAFLLATYAGGKLDFSILNNSGPDQNLFWNLRVPRLIMAWLIGASLALAGVVFQSLLKNPLADPYILGVSGGSALGYVVALSLGLSMSGVMSLGFLAALASLFLISKLATKSGVLSLTSLLLIGVMFNSFTFALILIINTFIGSQQAHQILYLLLGDVQAATWEQIFLLAVVLVCTGAISFSRARALDLLSLGDEAAQHLGVNVEKEKKIAFVMTSILVGITVSFCGLVGFVGLFVPHLVRLLTGATHRFVIPGSVFVGGFFLMVVDSISRHIISFEYWQTALPVGAVTALIGTPIFVFLLRRQMAGKES